MQQYSEKELERMWCWVVEALSFTKEETAAIEHQIPMTQEIYDRILDKCEERGPDLDSLFYRMLEEHPEFMIRREERYIEHIKGLECPQMSEEDREACRRKVYDRIRAYKKDGF